MKTPLLLLGMVLAPGLARAAPQAEEERTLSFVFKEASIEAVLLYASRVTGWAFVQEAPCSGTVTAYSRSEIPLSKCLEFLNAAIRQHGLVIRNPGGRAIPQPGDTLRVMELGKGTPDGGVHVGLRPDDIPATEDQRTQVIPLKSARAPECAKELADLFRSALGAKGQVVVSSHSNSIILTGRSDGIRRMVEILEVIDRTASARMTVRLIALRYTDATQMSRALTELFGRDAARGEAAPSSLGSMLRLMRPGADGERPSRPADRESIRVIAEPRMNAVLVAAPDDALGGIEILIRQLDVPSAALETFVVRLKNTDATTAATVLNTLLRDPGKAPTVARTPPLPGLGDAAPSSTTVPSTRRTTSSTPRR